MGYNQNFIKNNPIPLPDVTRRKSELSINADTKNYELDYEYYSVLNSKIRRLPVLSASNILRVRFIQQSSDGRFRKDKRIGDFEQLNDKDYSLFNEKKPSTVHKGHMTKREDVQWDDENNADRARHAAESTFFYTNASPQHASLNLGIWKNLENSIIIKGRVPYPETISVFTGPILDKEDPFFAGIISDHSRFRFPILYWKVIYYLKSDGQLYHAGFIMSQYDELLKDGLIEDIESRAVGMAKPRSLKPFLDFKNNEQYQAAIKLIESLTNISFHPASDPHSEKSPTALQLEEVTERSVGGFPYIPLVANLTI